MNFLKNFSIFEKYIKSLFNQIVITVVLQIFSTIKASLYFIYR